MARKTLLLNNNCEVLNFLSERRMMKLLWNDKIEIISEWDEEMPWITGNIKYPATVKLKRQIKKKFSKKEPFRFSRNAIIRRDRYRCQFCYIKVSPSQITIDHIIPKSMGGENSFANCVAACKFCNLKKGHKTLEQAGMSLIKRPSDLGFYDHSYIIKPNKKAWHPDWAIFLGGDKSE